MGRCGLATGCCEHGLCRQTLVAVDRTVGNSHNLSLLGFQPRDGGKTLLSRAGVRVTLSYQGHLQGASLADSVLHKLWPL